MAAFAVSSSCFAWKEEPKPACREAIALEVASFSCPPPTLAASGLRLALTVRSLRGSFLAPLAKTIAPALWICPLPIVGSHLPSARGRDSFAPLTWAGATAESLMPFVLRKEAKGLARAIVVVEEPRGS